MAELQPELVEKVTEALLAAYGFVGPRTAERCARAALEASGHAELLRGLIEARESLQPQWLYPGNSDDWAARQQEAREHIDTILAKAGCAA